MRSYIPLLLVAGSVAVSAVDAVPVRTAAAAVERRVADAVHAHDRRLCERCGRRSAQQIRGRRPRDALIPPAAVWSMLYSSPEEWCPPWLRRVFRFASTVIVHTRPMQSAEVRHTGQTLARFAGVSVRAVTHCLLSVGPDRSPLSEEISTCSSMPGRATYA
jgi:hypothetical protein